MLERQLAVDMNPGSYVNLPVLPYSARTSITSGPSEPVSIGKSTDGVPSLKLRVASFSAMTVSPSLNCDYRKDSVFPRPAFRRRAASPPRRDSAEPAPRARAPCRADRCRARPAVRRTAGDHPAREPRSGARESVAGRDRARAARGGSASVCGRIRPSSCASNSPFDQQFLDLADRPRRVEPLRAHVDAIHDGVAAEQAVRVFKVVEALVGG